MTTGDTPTGDTPDQTPDDTGSQGGGTAAGSAGRGRPGLSAHVPTDPVGGGGGDARPAPSTAPGPGSGPGSRGRRAGFAADVRAELAETSALVRQHGGLLSEALPRLDDLHGRLTRLDARLDTLTGHPPEPDRQQNPGEAVSDDPTGEGLDDDGLDREGRPREVPLALQHGLPTDAACWPVLDADHATTAWRDLARFVARILNAWYALSRNELPDCWPVHRRAVLELAWCHHTYAAAADHDARPVAMAEWHTRWLPGALAGVAAAIDPAECGPGYHRLSLQQRRAFDEHEDSARQQEQARRDPAQNRPSSAPAPVPETTSQDETSEQRRTRLRDEQLARIRADPRADRSRRVPDPDESFAKLTAAGLNRDHRDNPAAASRDRRLRRGRDEITAEDVLRAEPSTHHHWINYYRAAAAEDLARRRAEADANPYTVERDMTYLDPTSEPSARWRTL